MVSDVSSFGWTWSMKLIWLWFVFCLMYVFDYIIIIVAIDTCFILSCLIEYKTEGWPSLGCDKFVSTTNTVWPWPSKIIWTLASHIKIEAHTGCDYCCFWSLIFVSHSLLPCFIECTENLLCVQVFFLKKYIIQRRFQAYTYCTTRHNIWLLWKICGQRMCPLRLISICHCVLNLG